VLGKQYRKPILNRVKIEGCSWKWFESYQKNGKSAKRPPSVVTFLALHLCPDFVRVLELFHPPAYVSIVSSLFEDKEHS
jgi:hypothetical protein